jgi:aquaporin Z
MKKLIIEFIGTFILVATVGNASVSGSPLTPIAIGAALMIAVYAGGHISGAHYNPAVTIAVWRRGKIGMFEMFFYWGAQIAGAIVAAIFVRYVHSETVLDIVATFSKPANEFQAQVLGAKAKVQPAGSAPGHIVFVVEMLWTAVLAWVVLNVATAKQNAGNSFYGLAIGFTVVVGAIALGGISGGVFNPAVFIGLCVMKLKSVGDIFLFWGAQFLGGILAALAFKFTVEDKS